MSDMKSVKFDDLLAEELKNPESKSEYEAVEDEFSLAGEVMQLRENGNLTQKDLAKLVGTSQPAIARLESGNYKNLSLSFIRKVAEALGAVPEIHLKKAQ